MAFKKIIKKRIVADTPEGLFNDLKTRSIKGLLAHQADMLRAYYVQHEKETDIALQLPTGSGKTLVGLLIAEWRRQKYNERVVYLCPTRQLVNQVVEQACGKYGLKPLSFIGKQKEYPIGDKTAYRRTESVAVTTYSSFFCQPTFFEDAQVIVLDDVHAADNYISQTWTVEINRCEINQKPLFDLLTGMLREHLSHSEYLRLTEDCKDESGIRWIEKMPTPIFYELIPQIIAVLDVGTRDNGLQYGYSRIRDHLNACHMYLSNQQIIIRPIMPPTKTHPPFLSASQRVYMSATLGEGGELERLTGMPIIKRLPVPSGWDKQGIGRRLFLFPELSLNEDDALDLVCDMIKEAKRALFLLPSIPKAIAIRKKLCSKGDYEIFDAKDLEGGKDKFIASNDAVALFANRYDGIDFIDDECRLLVIVGISRATNLQEQFLISRMCSIPLYNDRIITRIIQATGRCTRSPNDYSAVIILSDDFAGFLMKQEKKSLFHPELQAEIEFGIQQSRDTTASEILKNLALFLNQGDEWKEANANILDIRSTVEQRRLPAVDSLNKSVKCEVEYQYALWNESYKDAVDHCRDVLSHLSGDELKGYRAFWYYLAGSAAWLGSQKGITGLDQIAQDFYEKAVNIAPHIRWLIELANTTTAQKPKQLENICLIAIVERLEVFLEKCGTVNNRKFEVEAMKITTQLNSGKSHDFEKGHELLGTFLGYEAGNKETTAAPDPWWIADRQLCIIFEDHSPKNIESRIGANKVRQAESHPKWVKEKLELLDTATIISVMISPRSQVEKDAVPFAGEVRYWNQNDFKKWAFNAISVVRELRKNFPGRGDLAWRAEACEAFKRNNIAPEQLIGNILKNKLRDLEQA